MRACTYLNKLFFFFVKLNVKNNCSSFLFTSTFNKLQQIKDKCNKFNVHSKHIDSPSRTNFLASTFN